MSSRTLILLLTLALGLVTGAFGYSLLAARQRAATIEAVRGQAREEGRVAGEAAAREQLERELAALRPLRIEEAPASENKAGGVEFAYTYREPKSPALAPFHREAVDGDLFRHQPEIQAIDGMFVLPRPIRFVTAECGEINAFYSDPRGEVVLCYETMRVLRERGLELAAQNGIEGADADAFAQRYLDANVRFILLHETGHALITMLEIPITGREEDAVDQLATTLMLRFAGIDESSATVAENLRMASHWFLVRSTGQYNLDAYADAHALGEQRYFNLQCLLYGSDPARYLDVVTGGDLPEARARQCPEEARRVSSAWLRLLLPHVAPKFQMSEEKAEQLFRERARERARNADAPYVQ
ncbi:DUF4344 domain-containing metallopeptidase [Marilutibacter chinensis]|uniref:DUF4344 domain-containing metallopeptidase n=1 Tax=Marilutibacter chinensis TaxID=2912247 RepID=A0ABS9HXG8_9GAMM|nr:DUF4344 domain-containing metallopeptidase [Lysobacter chinensis]MCF7223566.1 DUF4344 domain-containing metallopeptidase [Lysobacter chinensis]